MSKYILKIHSCEICKKDLTGSRKKRCDGCRVTSICETCGKISNYKAKYKKCSACQYHWQKENQPELFAKQRKAAQKLYRKKTRDRKGLPEDHIFNKAPKGSGYVNIKGYIRHWEKIPGTKKYRQKYHHHQVMEILLGRELYDHERVHHLNGDRGDNRIENLELWSIAQPPGQRMKDKIKSYIEFLEGQGYKVTKQ